MKTSPFYPGPPEDLTAHEIDALAAIKEGKKVAAAMRQHLECIELVEESLCGWELTPQGDWRLAQGR
jgi:hypothetical protein